MSDFKAKMHQNRFRLRLCPRPRHDSLRRLCTSISQFYHTGTLTLTRIGLSFGTKIVILEIPWTVWPPLFCIISPNSITLVANYVIAVEVTPILCAAKSSPKNLLFGNVWYVAIFSEFTGKDCVKERYSKRDSEKSNCATLCGHLNNSWVLFMS